MHMADALLSVPVAVSFFGASGALLAYSAKKAAAEDGYENKLPLMGVLGAFVFAAQMINFSIPGTGSSGHLGGGLLLAALLGPYAAFMVMASVLLIQCLLFADGGLLALGCNVFNLAFWPSFVGLLVFEWLRCRVKGSKVELISAAAAVIVSVELGALSVVVQTLLSGRSELPFKEFSLLMLGIHFPIALVEALVAAGVMNYVQRASSKRWHGNGILSDRRSAPVLAALLGCAFFLAAIGACFASTRPDGLEWSIERIVGPRSLSVPAGKRQSC